MLLADICGVASTLGLVAHAAEEDCKRPLTSPLGLLTDRLGLVAHATRVCPVAHAAEGCPKQPPMSPLGEKIAIEPSDTAPRPLLTLLVVADRDTCRDTLGGSRLILRRPDDVEEAGSTDTDRVSAGWTGLVLLLAGSRPVRTFKPQA